MDIKTGHISYITLRKGEKVVIQTESLIAGMALEYKSAKDKEQIVVDKRASVVELEAF